ncbi:HypC/HybG/HupF family hydrogenase formation chaperone [Helicobacter cholecystus]|uniref:HypC/HybG/HupF family hydrogenase formation chaperone n=1 Tax=Helicobacter cholecystus TaxID=45498 RepID=A0A3D8IWY4_9HELI|nr:HypC/HybG/HupF family hydrogenase formation chaperone [Helicobacter cholecystus]RDU69563.1 HypC/HybG/HupF family hydrogenase formation chaperone [Helicobacter cholecystus]VEJ24119.1 hydrogenase isoenzymes formation protein [Helicobacter cholecystus]
MCLSIPSQVVSINQEEKTCIVDTMGTQREVSLDILQEEVEIGDYVLIHIGYAINKISKEYALQSLELYEKIVDSMQKEEDA